MVTEEKTLTLSQLIERDKITLKADYQGRDVDPDQKGISVDRDGWPFDAWKVTLRLGKRRYTVEYRMGTGHAGRPPSVKTVVDSLVSDADLGEENSLEDFCGELGYDEDSRKAEKVYKACQGVAHRLRQFLGEERYEEYRYAERDI